MSADVTRKTHETFLLFFFAAHANFVRVDHDHEIAGVDVRSENRLFFSAQKLCRLDRDLTEHLIFRIDQPPFAVNFAGFGGKRVHRHLEKGTEATGREGHCQPMESGGFPALKVLYGNSNAPQYSNRRWPAFYSHFRRRPRKSSVRKSTARFGRCGHS